MKYFLITLGCQMNKNDSERIAGILARAGFVEAESEKDADVILMNTCSVRESAENRIFGKMEDFMHQKETNPELLIGITGCMAGRDAKKEFLRRMPIVELYFPTRDMGQLPRWISELRPQWTVTGDVEADYLKINPLRAPSAQAYVTIQTGCNQFCTYCVVPYARGLEKNRPAADILSEIRGIASKATSFSNDVASVVEITLLGQTVNSYRASDPHSFSPENPYSNHFAALLWECNQIPGIERIHWTGPHPNDMTDEVIDALALPKQMNFLHLPVQSGSTEVLKRMNRKYTREEYLAVIDKVKAKRPGIALGTDIIVGFCGETIEEFEETVSLYKACDFDISYTAQYSTRSGTLAAKRFVDDVTPEEKRRRWDVLQALMEETALRKNQTFVGKQVRVLVERVEKGIASGNTDEMKLAQFPTEDVGLVGTLVEVTVEKAETWRLSGVQSL